MLTQIAIIATMLLFSGFFEGSVEALKYRYKVVKRKLPFLHDKFWCPALSYNNKYKNHDEAQGARFWFSTTALVWLTDGYHLLNFISNTLLFAACALCCTLSLSLTDAVFAFFILHSIYSVGCSLAIDIFFNK